MNSKNRIAKLEKAQGGNHLQKTREGQPSVIPCQRQQLLTVKTQIAWLGGKKFLSIV